MLEKMRQKKGKCGVQNCVRVRKMRKICKNGKYKKIDEWLCLPQKQFDKCTEGAHWCSPFKLGGKLSRVINCLVLGEIHKYVLNAPKMLLYLKTELY